MKNISQTIKSILFRAFPVLAVLFALLIQKVVPDSPLHPAAHKPYILMYSLFCL